MAAEGAEEAVGAAEAAEAAEVAEVAEAAEAAEAGVFRLEASASAVPDLCRRGPAHRGEHRQAFDFKSSSNSAAVFSDNIQIGGGGQKIKDLFRSVADSWTDTTTPHGRLTLVVLGGVAIRKGANKGQD